MAATSNLPSPFKSLINKLLGIANGLTPVAKSTLVAKLFVFIAPVLEVFRKTENVLLLPLAVAKSGFPSPSKSPTETETGAKSVVKSCFTSKLLELIVPAIVVLRNTETEFEFLFATAKSVFPSPSKSLTATELGFEPVTKSSFAIRLAVVKLPVIAMFRNRETVFE